MRAVRLVGVVLTPLGLVGLLTLAQLVAAVVRFVG